MFCSFSEAATDGKGKDAVFFVFVVCLFVCSLTLIFVCVRSLSFFLSFFFFLLFPLPLRAARERSAQAVRRGGKGGE